MTKAGEFHCSPSTSDRHNGWGTKQHEDELRDKLTRNKTNRLATIHKLTTKHASQTGGEQIITDTEQDGQTESIMGSKTAFVIMSITQTPTTFCSEMKIGRCSSSVGVSKEKKIHPSSRLSSDPSLNLIWFHHKKRQAVLVKHRAYISMGSGWDKDKGRTNRAGMELSTPVFCYCSICQSPTMSVSDKLEENG